MVPCLRLVRVVFLACAAAMVSGVGYAQQPPAKPPVAAPKDPVVATVNGQPIYLSELEVAQQSLAPQYRNAPMSAIFPALLNNIIDSKLVVADGKKNKIEADPALKRRLAFVDEQVIRE